MFSLRFRDTSGTSIVTFVPHHLGDVLSNKLSQQSPDVTLVWCVNLRTTLKLASKREKRAMGVEHWAMSPITLIQFAV